MFQSMLQDLRFAFRMLIKNPGFSVVSILTLALGLGANAAIFSVFNAVVLRPLPYTAPDRLVTLWGKIPGNGLEKLSTSVPEFGDYRAQTNIFSLLAAYSSIGVNVTGGSEPQRVRSTFATANIFSLLGVTPLLGRPFLPEEDTPGSDDVAVLSYGLWQRRFGGNPNIIGQVITINNQKCTIVGVMPSNFQFPSAETELWKPIAFTPDQFQVDQRGSHWLRVIGRLNPGISLAQAQAEMTIVANRLQIQNPDYYEADSGWGITVSALQEEQTREVRPTLVLMLAAVGFLLLIACANTGNLVLARVTMRRRELATRMALGAGQWRLIRQTATESMVLVTIGSGLGLIFSVWAKSGLVAFLQASNVSGLDDVGFDLRSCLFLGMVFVLTVMVFTILPAFLFSKFNVIESLKEGRSDGSTSSIEHTRFRTALVVMQTAAAVVVLICAGLTGRSLYRLSQVEPGFDPSNVLALRLSLPKAKYGESVRQRVFFDQLLQRLNTLPGVEKVGAVSSLPLTGTGNERNFAIKNHPPTNVNIEFRMTDGDYFRTMGMKLSQGRFFTERDREGAPRVALINETFARMFLANENPLDQQIKPGVSNSPFEWASIVGVVKDVKNNGLDAETVPEMYLPVDQPPLPDWEVNSLFVVVQGQGSPTALIPAVRTTVLNLDADLPVYNVASVEQLVTDSTTLRRFNAVLPGVFGTMALILAAIGLYGVLSFFVTRRTREIGIRLALGARKSDVFQLVIGQGMVPALAGIAGGLVCASGVARLMEKLLFQVSPTDWLTFVSVPMMLLGVVVLAAWIPARRATEVEPTVALRCD